MKKYLFILLAICIGFASCKHQSTEKVTEVTLPSPPVEKAVATQQFSPPAVSDNELAEGAQQDIRIDEPVGNADVKLVAPVKPGIDKKIIKEGDIRFETGNVAETRKQIISSLKHLGGYAEDDSETTDGALHSKEYTLSIRIPAKNFDVFLGTVSSTATKIDSRNIRIKDVTTQFIDIKARLDNKLQLEKRYLNLLNRAEKMRDLLDIEEKLTQIRSEIESTQSQLNYMSKQVAYSSLTITFYTIQPEQVAVGNGFGYKFKHALSNGWNHLQELFFSLISNWPWLIVFAVVLVLVKRWSRRRTVKTA
ncbi:DUF4349 domain-containing protein [Mucilaginibacter sp. 14171R-50]|uniref:DUF4349 domain-containing protein n=1 Tax=Mucilaginibacter sp. 14171R-50 TaxID=2703789 RepID=UPI00138D9439|nr:DUF4349 domain-containing protein [Mucilaginibacter sp. 14171R-50]QHS54754.1 DUF4349 domain-containing protein [Mucilaginibacter sp. 14171R-50]